MATERTAQDLVGIVTLIPGVAGMEPGIASTLRTIDSRLRKTSGSATRYGLVIDRSSGTVTIEIGVEGGRPVRAVVADVQRAVALALDDSTELGTVLVRVQSIGSRARPLAAVEAASPSLG